MNRIFGASFFKRFFLIIVLIHILFISPVGFDYTDGTYILNLAGLNNKTQGALYSELNYIRPPVSIWIHSLDFIFGNFSLLWSRAFYFIQLAISSFLLTSIIFKDYRSNVPEIGFLWATSTLVYLLSTCFFPPMSWHTVDGVFLISIGFYLYKTGNYLISSPIILLGILCKQSFYPIFFVFILIVVLSSSSKLEKAKTLISLIASIALFCLFFAWQGKLFQFIYSTFLQTQSKDLLRAGVWEYLFKLKEPINILLIVMTLLGFFSDFKFRFLFFIIYLTITLVYTFLIKNWIVPSFHFGLFFLSTFYILISLIIREKNNSFYFSVLFALALTWCSSISWGYRSPQFAAASLILFLMPTLEVAYVKGKLQIILFILFATNLLTFKYPYRSGGSYLEHFKKMQTSPPGINNLRGIIMSDLRFKELNEIQFLIKNLPPAEPILFGSSFTAGYLCFNRFHGQGITWPINVELGFHSDSILVKLNRINYSVLKVENIKYNKCEMCDMIQDNWNVVGRSETFILYSRN